MEIQQDGGKGKEHAEVGGKEVFRKLLLQAPGKVQVTDDQGMDQRGRGKEESTKLSNFPGCGTHGNGRIHRGYMISMLHVLKIRVAE